MVPSVCVCLPYTQTQGVCLVCQVHTPDVQCTCPLPCPWGCPLVFGVLSDCTCSSEPDIESTANLQTNNRASCIYNNINHVSASTMVRVWDFEKKVGLPMNFRFGAKCV